jgi:ribose transport system substrate-binding protein
MIARLAGKGKRVMVMRYVQGSASTEARAKGFIATATAAGLEIMADPFAETGTIEGSKNVAVNTLEGMIKDGKLELDGLFACNLYSALGVLSALDDLKKSGISTDLVFVGFDTSKKLVEAVQSGAVDALVAQNPEKMGYLATETIVKVVRGEPVEALVDTGAELVTRDNLQNDAAIRKLVGLE